MTNILPSENSFSSTTYSRELLQTDRPQAMYDKTINRLYSKIFKENPADDQNLIPRFKEVFLKWMSEDQLNKISGYKNFKTDLSIGCTHFIDDLYQTIGASNLMIFEGDYKYHWRLNNNIKYYNLNNLEKGKQLLISMPFPSTGDKHVDIDAILDRCLELDIPVHIDAAWLSCARDIHFDFSHPSIHSFAISLSKGLGLGGNRIAMRFSRNRLPGPITIMNDFNMNCQSLAHIGIRFMEELGSNYLWNKYGEAYQKICTDFNLRPTKAIHIALSEHGPVGVRLLLRHLSDK